MSELHRRSLIVLSLLDVFINHLACTFLGRIFKVGLSGHSIRVLLPLSRPVFFNFIFVDIAGGKEAEGV